MRLAIATDSLSPDPDDQLYWSASLGLDLAERTVLEAEVLVWRIVQQKSAAHAAFLESEGRQ